MPRGNDESEEALKHRLFVSPTTAVCGQIPVGRTWTTATGTSREREGGREGGRVRGRVREIRLMRSFNEHLR